MGKIVLHDYRKALIRAAPDNKRLIVAAGKIKNGFNYNTTL